MKTLLKYAGNKRNVMTQIVPFLGLTSDTRRYIEPFCGALGSSGNAHIPENVQIILSDANWELINLYSELLIDATGLEEQVNSWTCDEQTYYSIRSMDREQDWKNKHSSQVIAARTLYLNKRGFNGLFRINKHGYFTTPWNHNEIGGRIDVVSNNEFNEFVRRSTITNRDWRHALEGVGKGDVVYCDPPYAPVDDPTKEFGGYLCSFGWNEQIKLRDSLLELAQRGANVAISNSSSKMTEELYAEFNVEFITANRSLSRNGNNRGKTVEIVAWLNGTSRTPNNKRC